MNQIVLAAPEPKNHIKTLMRIGYDFNSAIADILDNSISAESTKVHISVISHDEDVMLFIQDNGFGMTSEELIENMKVSCKDPDESRNQFDLGRFGSGMKTASFSHARKLTVITKKANSKVSGACWDVDEIEKTNSWCLEILKPKGIENMLSKLQITSFNKGTIVIWENIPVFYSDDHIEVHDLINSKLYALKKYLALHFHKFMSGKEKIQFYVQNALINPNDPFLSNHSGSIMLGKDNPYVDGKKINIKLHILPHHDYLSQEELDSLGGVDEMYRCQGLYIYRSGRLIIAGGWMGLSRNFQLAKLARIEIDIPASLDHSWSTDVKKTTLQLPDKLKTKLRNLIKQHQKKSTREYEYRGSIEEANDFWEVRENDRNKQIQYIVDNKNNELRDIFLEIEDKKLQKKLKKFLNNLGKSIPLNNIYEKMSSDPKNINQKMSSFDLDLDAILKERIESLKNE